LRRKVQGWTKNRSLQTLIFSVIYIALSLLLSFPLSLYSDFFREKQYGLLNLGFGGWLGEQAIGWALAFVFGSLAFAILYAVIRRLPDSWPIWGSVVMILLMCFTMLIAPVYIDPLFNTYKPLQA
jgi:STE24 endopeptidase